MNNNDGPISAKDLDGALSKGLSNNANDSFGLFKGSRLNDRSEVVSVEVQNI